jgi:hypothetical protein
VTQGEYGKRMLRNLQEHAPPTWTIQEWRAPAALPLVMDDPEDYLPDSLPTVDLILSLGESTGVAELVPEIAQRTGATAVIAPIDRSEWLLKGLARQLEAWLQEIGVRAVFPKPFCSLTQTHYNLRGHRVGYDDPQIAAFAASFGRPRFDITVDPESKVIKEARVERDATCGCARHIAKRLAGVRAEDAEFQAGMLHHHYPCLAAMGIDEDFRDTLMHVSGNMVKEEVKAQVKPYLTVQYLTPQGRVENAEVDTSDEEDKTGIR